ncbi:MAG: exodeoxyribonuclease VII small subunit [Planctomycetota bacterium]|jgi:exodeoxyribonuclease VII small subunit
MAEDEKAEEGQGGGSATFEENLQRLEEIVQRLEEGNLPLDESLRLYEEGVEAFRRCQKLLSEADLKVSKLVETLEGELREEPFEPPQQ